MLLKRWARGSLIQLPGRAQNVDMRGCPATCPQDCLCKAKKQQRQVEEGSEFTDPSHVEKLAAVCDFIAENVDNIAPPNRGVLGSVLSKMAGEAVPPAVVSPEQLEVTTGIGGVQRYRKDRPLSEDAAAPQTAQVRGPDGLTSLIESNLQQGTPGSFPEDGPLHAGPSKTAGLAELADMIMDQKTAAARSNILRRAQREVGRRARRADKHMQVLGRRVARRLGRKKPLSANQARAIGYGIPVAGVGATGLGVAAIAGRGKNKEARAGEVLRSVDRGAKIVGRQIAQSMGRKKPLSRRAARALGYGAILGVPTVAAGGAGVAIGRLSKEQRGRQEWRY